MLPKSRELLQAVAKGEISSQAIEKLLRSGADINAQTDDGKGDTALIIAAKNGSFQTVQSLLDLKAAVNTRTTEQDTALMHAVLRGHHEIAALLLDKKADTNIQNAKEVTALMIAASGGFSDTVKLLLERNAAVNTRNIEGSTALTYAVFEGHDKVAELLLNNKADPNIQDTSGTTALITAANKGFSRIAELLLNNKANANLARTKDSITPLMIAASHHALQTIDLLLKAKADINKQDSAGDTALMHSLIDPEIESLDIAPLTDSDDRLVTTFKKLLEAKADIEIKNHQGQNALIIATGNGYDRVVDLLLKNDANLEVQEKLGYTALILAAHSGHSAIAKLLLEKKAAVNTKNKEGYTALIMAANHSYAPIVEMLLEARADVNSENTAGDTALLLAADPLFLSSEARADTNHLPICKMLLEANADPNIPNKEGHTALTLTTNCGYVEIVEMLLEARADVDIQTETGNTAFFMACNPDNSIEDTLKERDNRLTIIKMLLKAGATLDILNNEGKTALEIAQPFVLDEPVVLAEMHKYLKEKQITQDIYGLTDDQFRIWRNYSVRDLLFINNYYLYLPDTVCFSICLYLLPMGREEKVITGELQGFVRRSPALHIHRLQTDFAEAPPNNPLLGEPLRPKDDFRAKIKNFLTYTEAPPQKMDTTEAPPQKMNTNEKLIKLLLEEFSQFTEDKDIQSSLKTMCENLAKPQFKLSGKEAEDLKTICSSIIEDGRGDAFDKTRLEELYKTLSLILSGIQSQDNSTSCTQRRSASPGR